MPERIRYLTIEYTALSLVIPEKVRFRLRADFLNALNQTNLAGLNTNISSAAFGRFTSATARTIQLGARVSF